MNTNYQQYTPERALSADELLLAETTAKIIERLVAYPDRISSIVRYMERQKIGENSIKHFQGHNRAPARKVLSMQAQVELSTQKAPTPLRPAQPAVKLDEYSQTLLELGYKTDVTEQLDIDEKRANVDAIHSSVGSSVIDALTDENFTVAA